MEPFDWATFLRHYNADVLRSKQLAEALRYAEDDELRRAADAGWLGYPGAGEAQLTQAESLLRVDLPPTYRAFLRTSNGWLFPSPFIPRLRSAEELAWFRDTDPETIEIWSQGNPELGEQLEGALRISDQEVGGTAVYLLIPALRTQGGESDAWMFASWIPGERRYASFRELMEQERRSFLQLEGLEATRALPDEPLSHLQRKVADLRDQLREKARTYRQLGKSDPAAVLISRQTAAGLEEVADRVERLGQQAHAPAQLLSSLRALQLDLEAEHQAIQDRRL